MTVDARQADRARGSRQDVCAPSGQSSLRCLNGSIALEFNYVNCRGFTGGGVLSLLAFSPVSANTSLIAPTLDNNADVSIGMKITFALFVRVISFKLSM